MNDVTAAEHDVISFLHFVWAARKYLLAGMLFLLPVGILMMHFLPPVYEAEAIIAPPEDEQGSNALSHIGVGGLNLSSIASSLSPQDSASFASFLQALTSHQTAEDLQEKYSVLQTLYPEKWDADRKSWKPPSSFGEFKAFVKYLLTARSKTPLDSFALEKFLSQNFSYSQIQNSPFYTVSFAYHDRAESQKLLSHILSVADLNVRNARLARARQEVKYLESKLREVTVEEHRAALTNLIINQERTLMLAQSSAPFAFQMISPISASPVPSSPRWLFVIGACELLGALAGIAVYRFRGKIGAKTAVSNLLGLYRKRNYPEPI